MEESILITLDLKNEGIPRIIAMYLLNNSEWINIKKFIENEDFELFLKDDELSSETLVLNNNTLKFTENIKSRHIDAFKELHRNHFFTYDLLTFIKQEIVKPLPKKLDDIMFEMDEPDLDYYLMTKQATPEFSSLDDERVKEIVRETKKTVKMFKNNNN